MQVTKQDLKWAAEQGVIEAAQVDALWRALGERTEDNPKFDLINLVYFFGAFMVIGAMGWLMTSAWEEFGGAGIFAIAVTYATVFVLFGAKLWHRDGLKNSRRVVDHHGGLHDTARGLRATALDGAYGDLMILARIRISPLDQGRLVYDRDRDMIAAGLIALKFFPLSVF